MKTFKTLLILIFLLPFFSNTLIAQEVLDGAWVKSTTRTRRTIPYPPLREADIMWSKRIWRKIPLREKMNFNLFFPRQPIQDRKSLWEILYGAVKEGTLTAYDGTDDEFKLPLTITEVENIVTQVDTVYETNPETGEVEKKIKKEQTDAEDMVQYWLKEDWFFDRQRSVLDVRIIGIAPVKEVIDYTTGESKGFQALFWIHFPSARHILSQYEVFNRHNDSKRMSFDDLFMKRMFSSFISKESNVYDRAISEYESGLDLLLESERIEEEIRNFEHDLWSF